MNNLRLFQSIVLNRMNFQVQRTILSEVYMNHKNIEDFEYYRRTSNPKSDKVRIQKLYKSTGLKQIQWSIPHKVMFCLDTKKDMKFAKEIVKEFIKSCDEKQLQFSGDGYRLLGRFYWSCFRLKDAEAAKDLAELEVVKEVFHNEHGHIMNGYMQILYESGHYEDLVKVCEENYGNVKAQVSVMLAAALYRLGTPQAYAKAKSYDSETNHYRAKLITVLFAYQQKDFEFIENVMNYFDGRLQPGKVPKLPSANLKILLMLEKGQVKESLVMINQWLINIDEASAFRLNIMKDVFAKFETAIDTEVANQNTEVQSLWENLQRFNNRRYRVDDMTLEQYIFKPISLAPNPKKVVLKKRLEARNLSRGARIVGSQPDLPPE